MNPQFLSRCFQPPIVRVSTSHYNVSRSTKVRGSCICFFVRLLRPVPHSSVFRFPHCQFSVFHSIAAMSSMSVYGGFLFCFLEPYLWSRFFSYILWNWTCYILYGSCNASGCLFCNADYATLHFLCCSMKPGLLMTFPDVVLQAVTPWSSTPDALPIDTVFAWVTFNYMIPGWIHTSEFFAIPGLSNIGFIGGPFHFNCRQNAFLDLLRSNIHCMLNLSHVTNLIYWRLDLISLDHLCYSALVNRMNSALFYVLCCGRLNFSPSVWDN